MIKHVDFEEFMRWNVVGYQGTTVEHHLEGLVGNGESLAELYTVYWPKDSIRVIVGSNYAVARTVLAMLCDPRTRHMGRATADMPAELTLVRRPLAGPNEWASMDQVNSTTTHVKDRLLPGDLTVALGFQPLEMAEADVTYRLDLSTLPDS